MSGARSASKELHLRHSTPVAEGHLRLIPEAGAAVPDAGALELAESYRRLADVFHELLSEQTLDAVLVRIADTLGDLIPHDTITIYEADEAQALLTPVFARNEYVDEVMQTRVPFDQGITGWAARRREAVHTNQAHLHPRVAIVPGTPVEPEALISIPLIARSQIKGMLNMYRAGLEANFSTGEFELAKRFADAAALALDNAQIRERLEHQAQTDSLTGLLNHRSFYDRLLGALQEASRTHAPVAVVMLDIDDFKRINDVHGHGEGDELLRLLAETLRTCVRPNDDVCRLGGEEFAVIMKSCVAEDATRVAQRILSRLAQLDVPPIGSITVSIGLALGPEHAMNPRELAACAEAAMMTAKAHGKNRIMRYEEGETARPDAPEHARDIRSIAHLKMLQSLSGKLNRLNDVREIGEEIAAELRSLIDYHNCRVFLVEGEELIPVAFRGELATGEVALSAELLRGRVGRGITGRSAETGESFLIGDAANCEFGIRIEGTSDIEESLLAVPLRYGARVIGVIVIAKLGLDQFDEDDLRLLEVLAGHAAVAFENARLYESARREAESATSLLEFGRELAAASSLDEILQRVVELSAIILDSPRTSVWLEGDDGWIVLRAYYGHTEEQLRNAERRRYDASRAVQAAGREPFILRPEDYADVESDPLEPGASYGLAPLNAGGRTGYIVAVLPEHGEFGERELRLLGGLAHQARLALANASSFEGLQHAFVSTVEALANALEANDEYTSTHARWITDLALGVGRELDLDEPTLKRLELGALLHDIGKIGIPSEILRKPGRLTAEERSVMETHPTLGERIIAPIDRLQEVRAIVRHCHERWDGRGYPDGMVGDEIPLESRIIFVCDAYHAMTSDRPYRKRLTAHVAQRRLAEASASQFDPRVVDACLRVLSARG